MYFDASPTSVKPPLLSPTLHAVLWIWVFAYIGVAARMGLAEVTTSLERSQARPSVLTDMGRPYFVANIVGCFVMGVCQPLKSKYTYLESVWVGITTGFCGCCTTFATWQLFTAHQYLTQLGVNATFVFFIQLTCCFGAHWGGRYIGTSVCESPVELPPAALALQLRKTAADQAVVDVLDSLLLQTPSDTSDEPAADTPSVLLPRICLASFGSGAILVSIAVAFHQATWSSLWIGPFGALLRYALGQRLNRSTLPFGTLVANVLASAVNCIVVLWLREPEWVQAAIITGFCGSLSTVSSWINELDGMPVKKAVAYVALSHILAQVVSLTILGSNS
ncbi:hypothetical protein B5M09_005955 [Aphanomyces astaci]|uniref:Fluoride ion transporter CrcB n=1 Tax=Aphanomyces astaci TaxID=112090 RepID=A0A425CVL2_APHAT|nr:hypothetical protein B5M09_005955 [Aphanomyces astaci]